MNTILLVSENIVPSSVMESICNEVCGQMYYVIYEAGKFGYCKGGYKEYQKAMEEFNLLADDILECTKREKNPNEKFFSILYPFLNELLIDVIEYKIDNHKNLILQYKYIFNRIDFVLYIIECDGDFNLKNIKRNRNHFFYEKSKYFPNNIELIIN